MSSAGEVIDLEQLLGELLESPGPDRRLDRLLNGAFTPDPTRWRESAADPITPPLTGDTEVARYLVPEGWTLTVTRDGGKWGVEGIKAGIPAITVSGLATIGIAVSAAAVQMRLADLSKLPPKREKPRRLISVRRTERLAPPLAPETQWGWGVTARSKGRAWRMLYAGPLVFTVRWPAPINSETP